VRSLNSNRSSERLDQVATAVDDANDFEVRNRPASCIRTGLVKSDRWFSKRDAHEWLDIDAARSL
jgi:hypothetical protein